jgi:hypothetical protein
MSANKPIVYHDLKSGLRVEMDFNDFLKCLSQEKDTNTKSKTKKLKKCDLKKMVEKTKYPEYIFGDKKIDLKHLGNYILRNVLPTMYKNRETALYYHNIKNDIMALTDNQYDTETTLYTVQGLEKCDADTEWYVDYMLKGVKTRCHITAEIWYSDDEDKQLPISPIAHLLSLHTSDGFTILKIRWE